jgi:mevalonate kinase
MPAIFASAPGKIILFGEHAAVYGQPAVAIPVTEVKAKAVITPNPTEASGTIHIQAPDIHLDARMADLPDGHPLKETIQIVLSELSVRTPPSMTIRITSTIPPASGLGSGAAVSVATIRAISSFLGKPMPDSKVSELAYQIEKIYHGTPSGIDNTVVTYGKPVFFLRNQPVTFIQVKCPFTIVIGDTGLQSSTASVVNDVRRHWEAEQDKYEEIFKQIGLIARSGRDAIESGDLSSLGQFMSRNHALLQELTVSSPELDRLIEAALGAGAVGAKLSGGGRGGNMIALAGEDKADSVAALLRQAGAVRTIITRIEQKA